MIDTHAHLCADGVFEEIDPILKRASEAGVRRIVNICTNPLTLERGIALHKKYPWVYNAASTTPHDAEKEGEEVFPIMEKAAREGALVAIGETGLDYYYYRETKDVQIRLFRRYIELALELNLPIVIHCREAFEDLFLVFDDYPTKNVVLHSFTGTMEEAKEVIQRGWMLSLNGISTFKKSEELREVAKMVPKNQLLIETDTPYLAPQPWRGKRNEPSYLIGTARVLAETRGESLEEFCQQTEENGLAFFGLSK